MKIENKIKIFLTFFEKCVDKCRFVLYNLFNSIREVIEIKKRTAKYRLWIKHRNEKNLKRRTAQKSAIKAKRTKVAEYNRSLKRTISYNEETRNYEFSAPLRFSFIKNPNETSDFFNQIIAFISNRNNFGKKIFIDISGIEELTIDALMYLLAIVNNLNENFRFKYRFSGNAPKDPAVRKLFNESGFYNYVKYQGNALLTQKSDTIQIVSGQNSDTDTAKQLSDFVSNRANVPQKVCRFIYVMMIELMSNTHKHAYNDSDILSPQWYCFAQCDSNVVNFTFVDTGEGIPSTVRKNFAEKLDILRIKGECKYVTSALDGKFRTATNLLHRGKGLPKIREICASEKIKNMRIITNKADVLVEKDKYTSKSLNKAIRGTVYYWQIDLSSMKGEQT